ncbi:MAG: hypothetical protein AAF627_12795 [Myxococcota bacterium]
MSEDQPTIEECIDNGMYWFGRSDMEAARAWWDRGLELDPSNERLARCIRLLEESTSTGFKGSSWADDQSTPISEVSPFASQPRSRGLDPTIPDAGRVDGLPDEPSLPSAAEELPDEPAPEVAAGRGQTGSWRSISWMAHNATNPNAQDPLDFATDAPSGDVETVARVDEPNPWDSGPAITSPLVVSDDEAFDAVADPTPLPELDREAYFDRYPETPSEIVDFLRATGDLEPQTEQDALQAARDKAHLHDFEGVLELLEGNESAVRDEEARALVAEARSQLMKMFESKIGDFDRSPKVNVSEEEIIWLNLNHRAGFILSQIDGSVTFEDLVALSGMPRLDTVRILSELLQQRVIE